MITVYVKPNCVQCDQTKKFLDRSEIEYTTIDIDQDQEALEKVFNMGFRSAPVVITDNDAWSGFRLEKLKGLATHVQADHQRVG